VVGGSIGEEEDEEKSLLPLDVTDGDFCHQGDIFCCIPPLR